MNAQNAFARGIQRLRRERGWTQAHLAEAADLSLQFLASLEQAAKTPSFETIDALCGALRVQTSDLFAAGEETTPKAGPSRELLRAVAALPTDREKDVIEIVHVVSRMLAKERARKSPSAAPKPPSKRARTSR